MEDGGMMDTFTTIGHYLGNRLQFLVFCLTFSVNISAFACDEVVYNDTIWTSQFYDKTDKISPYEATLITEEQTLQKHNGYNVYSTIRQVEYRISKSDSKLTIKRKVISAETKVLCENKDLQHLYPNVTTKLISAMLQPRKIKLTDLRNSKIPCSIVKSDKDSYILIDKLSKFIDKSSRFGPVKPIEVECKDEIAVAKVEYMGETAVIDKFTEKLFYIPVAGHFNFDALNHIISDMCISVRPRNGTSYQVEIEERITIK